jgi:hypothetical protein
MEILMSQKWAESLRSVSAVSAPAHQAGLGARHIKLAGACPGFRMSQMESCSKTSAVSDRVSIHSKLPDGSDDRQPPFHIQFSSELLSL